MFKKFLRFFIIFLLFLTPFRASYSKEQDETQIWKMQEKYFHYSVNVIESFSNKQSIGFQVDLVFKYLGIVLQNETKFSIQTHTTLANYAGTETATGYENLQTRLLDLNLTNSLVMQSVLNYLGFKSNEIYNPFVNPTKTIFNQHNVDILTYNHTFAERTQYKWFGNSRNVSVYEFKDNGVSDSGYYDNVLGILFFARFTFESSSSAFNASIRLLSTSLPLLQGGVPLVNYLVAITICIAIPLTIIFIYYFKKYKSKKMDSGGLK